MTVSQIVSLPRVGMTVQFTAQTEKDGRTIPFICAAIVTGVYRRVNSVTSKEAVLVRSEDGQGDAMEVDCLVFLDKGMMVAKQAPYSSLLTVGAWRHQREEKFLGKIER